MDNENQEKKVFDISKEDQKYIKRVCQNDTISFDDKIDILIDYFNLDKTTIEEMVNFYGMSLSTSQFAAAKLHTLKKSKRYIITSAQTASPVNINFLNNIKAYAKRIDAEIGIIATRYRNPTSLWKEEGDVWDTLIHPYLTANRQYLHENLLLLADLKIQATSPNPTGDLALFGGSASVIVGSPRIEMISIPTLPSEIEKFVYSTGSVTVPSFTDTVAGGKAAEHHSYGFVIVEIESDDVVHMRSVSANEDGDFNDLIFRIEDQQITEEKVDCLVWGDSHFAQKKETVTEAFRKLCYELNITTSVLHDIWDSKSLNVHNINNKIAQHKLMKSGDDNLQAELDQMYAELEWFEYNMEKTIVVASNHDDMLDRAMQYGDWRDNMQNAELFVKLLGITLSGVAENGLIPYFINNKYEFITALGIEESFIFNGIELGLHGHKGANGAKGNIKSFSKLSVKTVTGHSHAPSIKNGCYQVGVACRKDHGYNKGLSGWAYAGVTVNKHGKRQLIVLNDKTLTYTTLY